LQIKHRFILRYKPRETRLCASDFLIFQTLSYRTCFGFSLRIAVNSAGGFCPTPAASARDL
jgi:hypothetical protein